MVGPIFNSVGILSGSIVGAILGNRIPGKMRDRLPMISGLVSMGLGITMITRVQTLPAVVLALLLGTVIGELLQIERGVLYLAGKARSGIEKVFPPPKTSIDHNEFIEKFVAVLVLFSVSGTGIFGAFQEGISGDPSLLIVKSFLDFFTAVIFATSLGLTLAAAAVPQFLIQFGLFAAAAMIVPLTNDIMIADFSAVGGFIMLATGFKICGIFQAPVISMLPALLLAMPLSHLWVQYIL